MNRLKFLIADLHKDVKKTVYHGDFDKAMEEGLIEIAFLVQRPQSLGFIE